MLTKEIPMFSKWLSALPPSPARLWTSQVQNIYLLAYSCSGIPGPATSHAYRPIHSCSRILCPIVGTTTSYTCALLKKQGDRRNVSRPLARIHSQPTHTSTNNQGWTSQTYILRNHLIIVWSWTGVSHLWSLTYLCDLWPQNIMEVNIGHRPTKFGYKKAYGWKVINRNGVLQVNFHIWPHLTY